MAAMLLSRLIRSAITYWRTPPRPFAGIKMSHRWLKHRADWHGARVPFIGPTIDWPIAQRPHKHVLRMQVALRRDDAQK